MDAQEQRPPTGRLLNPVLAWLQKEELPLTMENFLAVSFGVDSLDELKGEQRLAAIEELNGAGVPLDGSPVPPEELQRSSEPDPLPVEEEVQTSRLQRGANAVRAVRRARQGQEPAQPEEPDDLAGVMRKTGLSRQKLEEMADYYGF